MRRICIRPAKAIMVSATQSKTSAAVFYAVTCVDFVSEAPSLQCKVSEGDCTAFSNGDNMLASCLAVGDGGFCTNRCLSFSPTKRCLLAPAFTAQNQLFFFTFCHSRCARLLHASLCTIALTAWPASVRRTPPPTEWRFLSSFCELLDECQRSDCCNVYMHCRYIVSNGFWNATVLRCEILRTDIHADAHLCLV